MDARRRNGYPDLVEWNSFELLNSYLNGASVSAALEERLLRAALLDHGAWQLIIEGPEPGPSFPEDRASEYIWLLAERDEVTIGVTVTFPVCAWTLLKYARSLLEGATDVARYQQKVHPDQIWANDTEPFDWATFGTWYGTDQVDADVSELLGAGTDGWQFEYLRDQTEGDGPNVPIAWEWTFATSEARGYAKLPLPTNRRVIRAMLAALAPVMEAERHFDLRHPYSSTDQVLFLVQDGLKEWDERHLVYLASLPKDATFEQYKRGLADAVEAPVSEMLRRELRELSVRLPSRLFAALGVDENLLADDVLADSWFDLDDVELVESLVSDSGLAQRLSSGYSQQPG